MKIRFSVANMILARLRIRPPGSCTSACYPIVIRDAGAALFLPHNCSHERDSYSLGLRHAKLVSSKLLCPPPPHPSVGPQAHFMGGLWVTCMKNHPRIIPPSFVLRFADFFVTQAGTPPTLICVFSYTVMFPGPPFRRLWDKPGSNSGLLRWQSSVTQWTTEPSNSRKTTF
jgi:hypothetical protein